MDQERQLFAIIYTPGPNWQEPQGQQQQYLDEHDGYINELRRKRKVKQGSTFRDKKRGAPIVQAKNEDDAWAVAAKDPAVKSGVLQAEVLPWNIVFGTKRGI